MSKLAEELNEKQAELADRIRRVEESQRVLAATLVLFAKTDEESRSKQRVIRIALGMGE